MVETFRGNPPSPEPGNPRPTPLANMAAGQENRLKNRSFQDFSTIAPGDKPELNPPQVTGCPVDKDGAIIYCGGIERNL
ncbi:MAG: hypothetical protein ACE5EK_06680 [Nitrospinales bacterium]